MMLPLLSDRSLSLSHSSDEPVLPKKTSRTILSKKKTGATTLETLSTDEGRRTTRLLSAKQQLVDSVRTRRSREQLAVSPELASKVVKDYLLPLFEADARSFLGKQRRTTMNTSAGALKSLPGTVYGELKLSEKLKEELDAAHQRLSEQERRLHDSEQSRISIFSDFSHLQQVSLDQQASLELLRQRLSLSERQRQQHSFETAEITQQLAQITSMYSQCDEERKVLTSALHEEKARNDKLRNRATELEQGNSLMRMENDVMGERLKGLYTAVSRLCENELTTAKLKTEVEEMAGAMKTLSEFAGETKTRLREVVETRDQLVGESREMAALRNELKVDKEKLAVVSRERITALTQDLTSMKEQLESTQKDLQSAEKRYKDLEDEHNKLRAKVKQFRLKRKQFGESETKVCRWCQKEYFEGENYNWSCRTHTSEFGDQMYWCCGKKSKDAPGCQTRKHESKEDEDELESKDKAETEKQKVATTTCPVHPK